MKLSNKERVNRDSRHLGVYVTSFQIVLNIQIYGPWGGEQGDNRVKYGLALNADLQP